MEQLRVDYGESFNLSSSWYVVEDSYENMSISSGPSTASETITIEYTLPSDAEITSARLYSTWSSPNTGFKTRTVNGATPTSRTDGYVDVDIDPTASSVSATFRFRANGSTSQGTGTHSGATTVSNVYLLIDYTTGGSSGGGESGGESSKPMPPAKLYLAGLEGDFVKVKPGTIFDLSWDASTSQSIFGYMVYYSDNDGESYLPYGSMTTSLTVEVAASDQYAIKRIFRVRTICADGAVSEYSNPISITTAAKTSGSRIYRCENGTLVPYYLYRCEGGTLVQYNLYYCQNGTLVQY